MLSSLVVDWDLGVEGSGNGEDLVVVGLFGDLETVEVKGRVTLALETELGTHASGQLETEEAHLGHGILDGSIRRGRCDVNVFIRLQGLR